MTVIARFNAAIFRSLTVTACVAATVVGGGFAPAAGTEPAPAAAGPLDEAAARAAARASGHAVEVTAKRTETETLYANPSGTLSMVMSTEAVRTKRNGEWVPVDPTFVRRADGSVAPVATTVDVALSGGGTTEFARVGARGKSLTLHWPSALPAPVLDGATATYPEVLPGVDLVATATPSSFREVLVVKDRAAALNPALRRVVFGLSTNGLTVTRAEGGGLAALDADGVTVLRSPEPVMWDSSGSALAAGNGPRENGPRDGDRMGRMRADLGEGRLALTPDPAMLADPSVTFPLYLDPTFDPMPHPHWTMVDESFPTTEYWKFTGDQGVGYQNFSGVSKKRQYHAFTTVEAWVTPGVTSATNWSNQPATTSWIAKADTQTVAYGRDGCAPNGDWVEFDVEAELQTIADAGGSSVTFALKAWSESNSAYWKRFDYATQLHVEWGHDPAPKGYDRDEYPPAMLREGGTGSSVREIPRGDNRGAGASIGNQCRALCDGTKIEIVVTK